MRVGSFTAGKEEKNDFLSVDGVRWWENDEWDLSSSVLIPSDELDGDESRTTAKVDNIFAPLSNVNARGKGISSPAGETNCKVEWQQEKENFFIFHDPSLNQSSTTMETSKTHRRMPAALAAFPSFSFISTCSNLARRQWRWRWNVIAKEADTTLDHFWVSYKLQKKVLEISREITGCHRYIEIVLSSLSHIFNYIQALSFSGFSEKC